MSTDAIQQEIRALEDRRYQAMVSADASTLEELLGDGLVYTHAHAGVETKAEFIEAVTSRKAGYQRIERPQETIQIYGDTAVVTGEAHIHLLRDGAPVLLRARHLNVWVKVGGRWQMVAWESTRIA
jgi:hypothetical protein